MNQDIATKKKSGRRAKNADFTLKDHYLEQLRLAPGVLDLLGNGTLVDGNIKSAGDYSYSSDRYSGENFRIVGDAGAFIDPFFSYVSPDLVSCLCP
jgi:flavin-dependent dehydrogenase